MYANGGRLARATGSASTGTVYYHGDHLGTARMETNAAGTVIAQCTYAPFGQVVTCPTDDGANHYRFTAQERDAETGLDNFRAREFMSQFGRFSQPDPAGLAAVDPNNPQTWNRYAYTANNPTNFVDPSGMYQCGWSYTSGWAGEPPSQHQEHWEPCYADDYAGYTQALAMALNGVSPFGLGMMPCGYTGSLCQNTGGGGGTPNQQTQPTQTPTEKYKECLQEFYNSKAGKLIGFFSPLSALPITSWNQDWKTNAKEWLFIGGGKVALGGVASKSGKAAGSLEVPSIVTGEVATTASELAATLKRLAPAAEKASTYVILGASAADVLAHAACAQVYAEASGMTPVIAPHE